MEEEEEEGREKFREKLFALNKKIVNDSMRGRRTTLEKDQKEYLNHIKNTLEMIKIWIYVFGKEDQDLDMLFFELIESSIQYKMMHRAINAFSIADKILCESCKQTSQFNEIKNKIDNITQLRDTKGDDFETKDNKKNSFSSIKVPEDSIGEKNKKQRMLMSDSELINKIIEYKDSRVKYYHNTLIDKKKFLSRVPRYNIRYIPAKISYQKVIKFIDFDIDGLMFCMTELFGKESILIADILIPKIESMYENLFLNGIQYDDKRDRLPLHEEEIKSPICRNINAVCAIFQRDKTDKVDREDKIILLNKLFYLINRIKMHSLLKIKFYTYIINICVKNLKWEEKGEEIGDREKYNRAYKNSIVYMFIKRRAGFCEDYQRGFVHLLSDKNRINNNIDERKYKSIQEAYNEDVFVKAYMDFKVAFKANEDSNEVSLNDTGQMIYTSPDSILVENFYDVSLGARLIKQGVYDKAEKFLQSYLKWTLNLYCDFFTTGGRTGIYKVQEGGDVRVYVRIDSAIRYDKNGQLLGNIKREDYEQGEQGARKFEIRKKLNEYDQIRHNISLLNNKFERDNWRNMPKFDEYPPVKYTRGLGIRRRNGVHVEEMMKIATFMEPGYGSINYTPKEKGWTIEDYEYKTSEQWLAMPVGPVAERADNDFSDTDDSADEDSDGEPIDPVAIDPPRLKRLYDFKAMQVWNLLKLAREIIDQNTAIALRTPLSHLIKHGKERKEGKEGEKKEGEKKEELPPKELILHQDYLNLLMQFLYNPMDGPPVVTNTNIWNKGPRPRN